jgi:uncharacterized protein YcbK (DUF882 family)
MFALTVALLLGDVQHVVQRGHTIEAIAHRYHVSVKAIVDANHIKDPAHLKPGEVLTIPGVDSPKKKGDKTEKGEKDKDKAGGHDNPAHPTTTAALMPAPEPRGHFENDVVHAERLGEEFRIRMKDAHGHIPPSALAAFERMMRQGNATHPIDPRLVALVGIVSSHFGGKTIEVVSGYRAYTPTQYTPHSNHNLGRALDFRVQGVSNEALRDFCRTLRSAGCGYYPNSSFVHLDVRETKTYWIDWSHPGEPPKYDKPDAGADEGTSDVPSDEGGNEGSTPIAPTAPATKEDKGATQPVQGQD